MSDIFTHIGEILARNGRVFPDDVALIERASYDLQRKEITWKQFDDRANQFAGVLVKKGIQKDDRIVHCMMNSIDWLVVYFGIIRTGAWAVPINFRFTAEDVKYCCNVADPKLIVFDEEFIDRITAIRHQLPSVQTFICVGNKLPDYAQSYEDLLTGAPATPVSREIGPLDACGLYFTSGTTGQPKPILLTHVNMLSACITENVHHRQTKNDCFILIPPLYHTGAKMHWFGSFIVGGKSVILKGISP
jgi:acyl-CoA synthetase (AMP-forming)/AMP-acid ligase II